MALAHTSRIVLRKHAGPHRTAIIEQFEEPIHFGIHSDQDMTVLIGTEKFAFKGEVDIFNPDLKGRPHLNYVPMRQFNGIHPEEPFPHLIFSTYAASCTSTA